MKRLVPLLLLLSLIHRAWTDRVEIKSLHDNPGILPLKLGPTKVQKTHHTFIHNYPLAPLREQMTKLEQTIVSLDQIDFDFNKKTEVQYLDLQTTHLKNQMLTIHPDIFKRQPEKQKRGIINALGSVFKFISGSLDADDGERYDQAIRELQQNQENIIAHFNQQISANKELIQNFQDTMRNISDNFKIVDDTLTYIQESAEKDALLTMIKIILLDLKTLIDELQTAIGFAAVNVLHLSIINEGQIDIMKNELKRHHDSESYYSNDNVLFVRTINVDFYITPNHIVFLLHVPIIIIDKFNYNLYHLYSIPTIDNTTIVPPTAYVAMADDHIYYLKERCKLIQRQYFCSTNQIERNYQQDTCVKNLLQVKQDPDCRRIPIVTTEPLVETINDEKYLGILPTETLIHEKCDSEEVHKLKGVYLIRIP